jgi:hypothetical protein
MCPKTKDIMLRLATTRISPSYDADWASQFGTKLSVDLKNLFKGA